MKNYVDKDKLQEFATKLHAKQKTIFATKSEIGSPLVASTVAEMTDESRIYVYTGSETGYTSGNWYYYNGSAWTSGGVYNSMAFETDATLAIPGKAADAKAVGDALANVEIEVDDTLTQAGMAADAKAAGDAIGEVEGDVSDLKTALSVTETMAEMDLEKSEVAISFTRRQYIRISEKTINTNAGSSYYLSSLIPVQEGEIYKLRCSGYGNAAAYAFANDDGIQITYPSYWDGVNSDVHAINDKIIQIPSGMTGMYIESYTGSGISAKVWKCIPRSIPNEALLDKYIADFDTDKASNISWISDYGIYKINLHFPRASTGYYIAHIDVKKGDIISLQYDANYPLSGAYVPLAEKIQYGSGSLDYGFRMLVESGVGNIEYVADKDMTVTVCGHEATHLPTVKVYSCEAHGESCEFAKDRFNQFPYNETTNKLNITQPKKHGTNPKPLSLLHFSDIHNSYWNTNSIRNFSSRYGIYINDIICTGDMSGTFADYKPIFALDDYKNIMLCIGNHDVYDADGTHDGSDSQEYWATNLQKYNQYFAPTISNWSVTQPTNATTSGLCYYYKDYTTDTEYGYRLIVLDAMAFDDAQYNWLVSTLADAKTNSLTVVIAEHFAPITGLSDINGFQTPFMSLLTGMEYNYANRLTTTAGSAMDAVDDFIDDGGEFACWLCGHMHYDQIATTVAHPNQIYIAVGCANSSTVWEDMPRIRETPSEDLFNIVSIDPVLKVIKIQRIGATIDDWGRIHDHVSVNYSTRTLIATS